MRRIAIPMSLLALGAAPPAANPAQPAPVPVRLVSPAPHCPTIAVAATDGRSSFRRLGELPPADAYQAVYRLGSDGCIDPLLVSERIRATDRPFGR